MFRIIALSTAAVLVAAGSASAMNATVRYGDLDLTTPAGTARLDARIASTANAACAAYAGLQRRNCRSAIRKEAIDQLPTPRRTDYTLNRRSFDV